MDQVTIGSRQWQGFAHRDTRIIFNVFLQFHWPLIYIFFSLLFWFYFFSHSMKLVFNRTALINLLNPSFIISRPDQSGVFCIKRTKYFLNESLETKAELKVVFTIYIFQTRVMDQAVISVLVICPKGMNPPPQLNSLKSIEHRRHNWQKGGTQQKVAITNLSTTSAPWTAAWINRDTAQEIRLLVYYNHGRSHRFSLAESTFG